MKYKFEYADSDCINYLKKMDKHIESNMLHRKVREKEVIIVKVDDTIIGWLRFNYFWDNTPFMNMLWIEEPYRSQGVGKALVAYWEEEMKKQNYEIVMTSTLSNESAQHFYRKLGYVDRGSLLLDGEALEIIFIKPIKIEDRI